jgi:hypothetical protein
MKLVCFSPCRSSLRNLSERARQNLTEYLNGIDARVRMSVIFILGDNYDGPTIDGSFGLVPMAVGTVADRAALDTWSGSPLTSILVWPDHSEMM